MAISAHLDPLQPAPRCLPTGFSHARLVEVQNTKLNIWYGSDYKAACELTIDDSMIGTKILACAYMLVCYVVGLFFLPYYFTFLLHDPHVGEA